MATKTFSRVAREREREGGREWKLAPNRVAYVCQKLIKNSLQIHTQQVATTLCRVASVAENKKECEMSRRLGFKCLPKPGGEWAREGAGKRAEREREREKSNNLERWQLIKTLLNSNCV